MNEPRKPHVVRRKLADGTVQEYVYAYRGGPRINGHDDPSAPEKIKAHRSAAYKAMAKGRRSRDEGEFLLGEESAVLRSVAAKMVRNAKVRASKRGLPLELATEHVYQLLRAQKLRCAVSGLPFDLSANLERTYARNPFGPSIDRIDNRKGYTTGNVRLVLVACNFALNEWGEENFRMIAKAVAEHRSTKNQ